MFMLRSVCSSEPGITFAILKFRKEALISYAGLERSVKLILPETFPVMVSDLNERS